MIAHQVGKNDVAVDLIEKAIAIQPDYAEAHFNLGRAFHSLRRLEEAAESYYRALAIKSDNVEAHNNVGVVLEQLGRLDEALSSYNEALIIQPNYFEAHYNRGNVFNKLGRLDEALASYRQVLTIMPYYVEAHNYIGVVLKELGRLDEALASYRQALAINSEFAEAHYNIGVVLNDLKSLDEAVESYQKALSIKPDYAQAHCNIGNVFKELGRLDEAITSYHEALEIAPDHIEVHINLGNALAELGKLYEAIGRYHKALAINPNYAVVWHNLRFASKAIQFLKAHGERTREAGTDGLSNAARSTVGYALHQFYLVGYRPHEADESFRKIITALPSKEEQVIPIRGAGGKETGVSPLPDKVVALLHVGRSGTGLLHSLIDGHREVSTLPSIYVRCYFSEGVWDKLSAGGWQELPQRFADEFAVLFDARSSKAIPSRLGEPSTFIGKSDGMTAVGENRDEFLSVDREAFCGAALRLIEGMKSINPMSFLMVVHAAFEEAIGSAGEAGRNKRICFYHIHDPDEYAMPNFVRYAPDARLLAMVREPIQNC